MFSKDRNKSHSKLRKVKSRDVTVVRKEKEVTKGDFGQANAFKYPEKRSWIYLMRG